MPDPLAPYPPMMSVSDLKHFLGIAHSTAWEEIQRMRYTVLGGGNKRRILRVSKEEVRKRYNLPEPKEKPLRIVK